MRIGKVALCLVLVWCAAVAVVSAQPGRNRTVPGQLLVTFGPTADATARGAAHRAAGGRAVAEIAGTRVALVSVAPGDEAAAIARYRNDPSVRSAEPNYIRRVPEPTAHDGGAVVPRDAYFGQQWGFHNTGQEFYCFDWIFGPLCFYQGVADADIDAPEAWAVSTGSPSVVVAVIDTGVDYNHPDLASRFAGGYNFVAGNFDPLDDHGHGTHVAGTIAAGLENMTGSPATAEGVVGVAPEARILAYKVCAGDGTCTDSAVIAAIGRAVADGARVINMSLGATDYSQALADAVQAAWAAGVVIVAGAGNDGTTAQFYPAALDNVVAVGAFDENHLRASFSNYGSWVDIAAPGSNILSTYPLSKCEEVGTPGEIGCYAWLSGTSMATPHVAGAAALLWARGDVTSNTQVMDLLLRTADASGVSSTRLDSWTEHGGLNLHDAMSDGAAAGRPVANAGPDETVKDLDGDNVEIVSLDGSASHDDNGTIVAYEWREDAVVLGASAQLAVPLGVGTHTLTLEVTDNDGLIGTDRVTITVAPGAMVAIAASTPEAREAGVVPGTFTVTRDGDPSTALTVAYAVTGTAIAGTDYQALSGTVLFAPGAATATIPVVPIDDLSNESNELVTVTLIAGAGYGVTTPGVASLSIVSDDLPPDLVVTPTAPGIGGADVDIVVNDTTKNQGAGPTAASATGFYLSTNSSFDAADVFLGSRPVPPLAPSVTNAGATTLRIPAATVAGSYYVIAKADWNDQISESSNTNNVRSTGVIRIGPDVTVSALAVPATAAAGVSFSALDTTQNVGGARAPVTSTHFYLSSNPTLDASDVLIGSRSVTELAAGVSHVGTATLMLPASTPGGSYYVIASADGPRTLAEPNETNNSRSSLAVRVGADLVVSVLSVSGMAPLGGTISVNDSTKNQGAGPATDSATGFYLSANSVLDASDLFLGSRPAGALAPGVTNAAVTPLTIPTSVVAGSYYLVAKADWADTVPEGVESNNTRSVSLRIGPDLRVTAVTAPASAVAGSSITVGDMTANEGPEAVPATTTRYYLSTNATLSADDVLIGSRPVGALPAGASQAGSATVVVPAGLTPRTYYVVAAADGDNTVAESVETNNTKGRSISITAPPGS